MAIASARNVSTKTITTFGERDVTAAPAASMADHGLPVIDALELSRFAGAAEPLALIDLRPSTAYRQAHAVGALWSIRPVLTAALAGELKRVASGEVPAKEGMKRVAAAWEKLGADVPAEKLLQWRRRAVGLN